MRRDSHNRWLTFIFIGLLALSLGFLIWFRGRMLRDMNASVESTARLFDASAIRQPQDVNISFSDLERLLDTSKLNPFIADLVVTKSGLDGSEHPIAPFHLPVTNPGWREQLSEWRRLPVVANDIQYGAVYVHVDERVLSGINYATAGFSLLFFAAMGLFVWRLRSQEEALQKSALALEEQQSQMIRMERLALAGQLTANVFHDIKKPVLNMRHAVEEQKVRGGESGGEAAEPSALLNELQQQIALFLSMLQELNLERFVRAEDTEQEYVDIHDILNRSLNLVKYEQGDVKVKCDFTDKAAPVFGFPWRLIQVFSNIILNAFQAMNGRGKLNLTTKMNETTGILTVSIEDSGPGIPKESFGKIFTPFYTTQTEGKGSGLGLYIVKTICGQSNIHVSVSRSDALGGARFDLNFRVSED